MPPMSECVSHFQEVCFQWSVKSWPVCVKVTAGCQAAQLTSPGGVRLQCCMNGTHATGALGLVMTLNRTQINCCFWMKCYSLRDFPVKRGRIWRSHHVVYYWRNKHHSSLTQQFLSVSFFLYKPPTLLTHRGDLLTSVLISFYWHYFVWDECSAAVSRFYAT